MSHSPPPRFTHGSVLAALVSMQMNLQMATRKQLQYQYEFRYVYVYSSKHVNKTPSEEKEAIVYDAAFFMDLSISEHSVLYILHQVLVKYEILAHSPSALHALLHVARLGSFFEDCGKYISPASVSHAPPPRFAHGSLLAALVSMQMDIINDSKNANAITNNINMVTKMYFRRCTRTTHLQRRKKTLCMRQLFC